MFISWNNGIYYKGVAVSSIYMIYSDFPPTVDSTLPLYKILSFMCWLCRREENVVQFIVQVHVQGVP